MTRVVTYSPHLPPGVGEDQRAAFVFKMYAYARQRYGIDIGLWFLREQMDYCLDAPQELPAGACVQDEVYLGRTEFGFDEYMVTSHQPVVDREWE